eukprot:184769_1
MSLKDHPFGITYTKQSKLITCIILLFFGQIFLYYYPIRFYSSQISFISRVDSAFSAFNVLNISETPKINASMINVQFALTVTDKTYPYHNKTRCNSKSKSLGQYGTWNVDELHHSIYIHVPKTGGTAIEERFRNYTKYIKGSEHYPIEHYLDICPMPHTFCCDNDYFVFGFVRNPYLRTISMINYFHHGGNGHSGDLRLKKLFRRFTNLNEFVDYFEQPSRYATMFRDHEFFKWFTQTNYLLDSNGIYYPDFLGRFETFDADLERLSKILKLDMSVHRSRLTHYNKRRVFITPKFVDFVNDYASDDFLYFNYTKIQLNRVITLEDFEKVIKSTYGQ